MDNMFKGNDINMYVINDDVPSDDEMNEIIDEEIMADYEQCEWVCDCGCEFNTEEGVVDGAGNVECKDCGEIVMCDEFNINEEEGDYDNGSI